MKKMFGLFCLLLFCIQSGEVAAEKLDYEKYGRIAIAVVQADYPQDEVTDYEYRGRNQIDSDQIEDTFMFKVKEKGKDLNVLVKIRHSTVKQKLLNLSVEEITPTD